LADLGVLLVTLLLVPIFGAGDQGDEGQRGNRHQQRQ
jgi:hypothetical protein